jgi:hypothetical protein
MKVRCIEGCHALTKGKIYEVVEIGKEHYELKNDDRNNGQQGWFKNRFEIVEEDKVMFNQKSGAFIQVGVKKYEIVSNGTHAEKYLEYANNKNSKTFYAEGSGLDGTNIYISYKDAVKLKDWLTEIIKYAEENKEPEEITALKKDIANIENTLKEMKDKLNTLESK